MKFSRRDFVHAGCTAVAASLSQSIVDKAEARFPRGYVPVGNNPSRVTINVPGSGVGLMNFAKGWAPRLTSNIDANGYPQSTPASAANTQFNMLANYYGQYVMKLNGAASLQFIGAPAILYSITGGAIVPSQSPAGTVTGNFTMLTTGGTSASTPRVVFKFGGLVSSVSASGGIVTVTMANSYNFSTGRKVTFNQGCSSNLVNGPNSDGSWTITSTGASTFTLNNSSGVVSPTVTGSGGVGTQTEAILENSLPTLAWLNSGTFASPTNLVICAAANETNIANGLIWDPAFVAQQQQLKGTPGGVGRSGDFWLRFMDIAAVQGSFECDFSQRLTLNSQCWTADNNFPAGYQAGAMTNGGASGSFTDLYSCNSNPSNSPASGPPVDCEIIQGTPSATNTGMTPGLTVAGRTGFGNWPIFNANIEPISFNTTVAPTGSGQSIVFTFNASYLNSGSNYVFTYTTVAGDVGNIGAFQINLQNALLADTTLKAAKILFTRNGLFGYNYVMPPTPLSGVLTVTYTSGTATITVGTLLPSKITASGIQTFSFSKLLGGFIALGSFVQAYPFESMIALCNLVGANLWYNWAIYTKSQYITDCTNFIASNSTGLTSGLKFGAESGNEWWNTFAAIWGRAQTYGSALGCFALPYGNNYAPYSWQGLQTINYANLSIAAWALNGRAASQHYIMTMSQVDDTTVNGNFDASVLGGQFLVTSNSNFANYGGLGCTTISTSYNAAPNRPGDITTAFGMAPYWGSFWMGGGFSGSPNPMAGAVAQNAAMLQASIDFANGLTSTAFGELTNQFNGTTTKSGGSTGAYNLGVSYLARFVLQEALAVKWSSGRATPVAIIHYEGASQWALANNYINGVNTADSTAASISADTTDVNALVSGMTNLGWTTTQLIPYTISSTGNLTEVATNIQQMSQGWKYDTDLNGAAANTSSYKNLIKTYYYQALFNTSGANREVHGAQYGYQANTWGLFWNTWNETGPAYQSFNAIAEYNG